jgi:hypothetical protein
MGVGLEFPACRVALVGVAAAGMTILVASVAMIKWVLPLETWLPVFIVRGAALSALGGGLVYRRFEAAA